ncbi:hypothetical protein Q3G72_034283 [Acer saccharum]|nr:hypothetical protein Q3G72_034283 [Acer saccharum]
MGEIHPSQLELKSYVKFTYAMAARSLGLGHDIDASSAISIFMKVPSRIVLDWFLLFTRLPYLHRSAYGAKRKGLQSVLFQEIFQVGSMFLHAMNIFFMCIAAMKLCFKTAWRCAFKSS